METNSEPLYKTLNQKRTQSFNGWNPGYTLQTEQTRRWDSGKLLVNDEIEGKILFSNFTDTDKGRGRIKIASFQNTHDAQYTALAVNNFAYLAEALEKALKTINTLANELNYNSPRWNDEHIRPIEIALDKIS